jgi:hypothetical protein
MPVQLTQQAAALLKEVQRTTGLFDLAVDQAIQSEADKVVQSNGAQQTLGVEQLEKILLGAMPAQKQAISDACSFAKGYHPDSKNPRFLTQILSMRIEKEHDIGVGATVPPRNRDPLYASFTLDPKADFMLLFNARDVDAKGQPLLMKVVVREGADVAKLDLSRYRTATGQMPDVVKVAKNATYVETKDIDETEFSFGDPLKQVSVAGDGKKELSSSVWVRPENIDRTTAYSYMWSRAGYVINPNSRMPQYDRLVQGEQLDTTPVKSFEDRVRLRMATKDTLPADAWLDTPGSGNHVDVVLDVKRGFIFEPGSWGEVSFNGMQLKANVDKTDAQLLGNAPSSQKGTPGGNISLRQLLQTQVVMRTGANPNGNDAQQTQKPAVDVIFASTKDSITVGANKLAPLGDVTLRAADMTNNKVKFEVEPISDDDNDGVKLTLKLEDGFLTGNNGVSMQGWKAVVGYTDAAGKWVAVGDRTVKSASSKAEAFNVDIDDFDALQKANRNLEVRLFNAEGIPAQRVILPFRDAVWAAGD